jgi:hypothetical protein
MIDHVAIYKSLCVKERLRKASGRDNFTYKMMNDNLFRMKQSFKDMQLGAVELGESFSEAGNAIKAAGESFGKAIKVNKEYLDKILGPYPRVKPND